jgi:hypothetical protein
MKDIRTTLAFFEETTATELQGIQGGHPAPVSGPLPVFPHPIHPHPILPAPVPIPPFPG